MSANLNPQQANFVSKVVKGYNLKDAAIAAGYSPRSADSMASQLIRNPKISKAIEKAGLTDERIAAGIYKTAIAGEGVKATADTSLRAYELAARLKGYLDRSPDQANLSQTNIYINELKTLDDTSLSHKLDALLGEVDALKTTK